MPSLSELVERRLRELGDQKPMSTRRAAEFVDERAGQQLVSHTTIAQMLNGRRVEIKENTVQALEILGIPRTAVYQSLGVSAPDTDEPFELPMRAQRLSLKQRDALLAVIDGFIEAQDRRLEDPQAVADAAIERDGLGLAARHKDGG